MQTFLPYADFRQSAQVLDMRRLGKQRVECLQILQTLLGYSQGWQNHPAVKMWRGYEQALLQYGLAICSEWIKRGYKDTCKEKMLNLFSEVESNPSMPPWLGDKNFHESHRSNLLRKNSEYYQKFQENTREGLEYVWNEEATTQASTPNAKV